VVVTWSNLSMYDHCWSLYDVPCIIMELSMYFLWWMLCYEMIFIMHLLCWDFMVCHTLELHLWYMQWIYLCIMPCLPCHEVLDTTKCR
jgi:hypothetical protein